MKGLKIVVSRKDLERMCGQGAEETKTRVDYIGPVSVRRAGQSKDKAEKFLVALVVED